MNLRSEVLAIRSELKAAAKPERATFEKNYLRSDLEFHGAAVPVVRKAAKKWLREHKAAGTEEVVAMAEALWSSRFHEERTVGIAILDGAGDAVGTGQFPLLERMVDEANTWAHLDWIAAGPLGGLHLREPSLHHKTTKWAKAPNFWKRRASILLHIPLIRAGEPRLDLLWPKCRGMLDEKEFFIRKAIGWIVRELSLKDPDAALTFLLDVRMEASGLTLREGSKRLPEKMKAQVLKG